MARPRPVGSQAGAAPRKQTMDADGGDNPNLDPGAAAGADASAAAPGRQQPPPPFRTPDEATRAAQLYIGGRVSPHQRRVLFERLGATPKWASAFLPLFAQRFHLESIAERQNYLDLFGRLLEQGADIRVIADPVAHLLSDTNYQLRQGAFALLLRMGPQAAPAVPRIVCALSSPLADTQINALRLLAAIGPRDAGRAVGKIRQILNGSPSLDFADAARDALAALDIDAGPTGPAAPPPPPPYPDLVRKRVLLVAPAPAPGASGTIEAMFTKCGAIPTVAAKGNQIAAALASELPYDLVLVDLAHLAAIGLGGPEMLHALRHQPVLAAATVYVLSRGALGATTMLRLAKYNVAGYLSLPLNAREMLTQMAMSMRREAEGAAARAQAAALQWLESARAVEQSQGLFALALLGPKAAGEGLPALAPAGGAPEMVAAEDKVRAILIEPPADASAQGLAGCRALVAESNRVIGGLLREALERHGAAVCQVNTLTGLNSALAGMCDLVLVATEFDGAGAGAAVRKVRQHPSFSTTPLLAYGAAADPRNLPFLQTAHVSKYLSTPFGEEELVAAALKALGERR